MKPEPRSAELLRALFVRTVTPMLLVNDERRYLDANPAACRLLRCDRESLLRLSIDDLAALGPETVPTLWDAFLREGTQSGRFAIRRPDGSRVEVNYSATAQVTPGVHLSVLAPAEIDDLLESESPEHFRPGVAEALTDREREVMTMLALGATGPEIAKQLFISRETVRNHARNARDKLGAQTRAQAIAVALSRGEIAI